MLNLWELMTNAECSRDALPSKKEKIRETLNELSARGMSGQEISIGSTERGWVIKIHSCFSDAEVVVLIPLDPRNPVEVVSDTRKDATQYDRTIEEA